MNTKKRNDTGKRKGDRRKTQSPIKNDRRKGERRTGKDHSKK